MNKSLYTVWTFTRINTKRFFRDKLAIFFTILFPLIFLFVFGFINKGGNEINFDVAVINQSDSTFSKQFIKDMGKQKIFDINKDVKTIAAADEKMSRSQLDAAIILPKSFGEVKGSDTYPSGTASVRYAQNNQQAGSALVSILDTQFKSMNAKITPQTEPFKADGKPTEQEGLSQFDYAFAGLLGFSIIGIGIFGPMNVFPELKKQGILRRLRMTPLRVWQYFVSTALTQVALGLISIAILFFFAVTVFDLHMVGNWLEVIPFLALSIVMILGIGLAIGGWAKNERQAAPLGNIVVFPMMFLSGTFFPRFLMPEWLQKISDFLPLTPVVDGIRLLVTEGQGLVDIAPQLGLIGAWLIVIYVIAFRFFRWE